MHNQLVLNKLTHFTIVAELIFILLCFRSFLVNTLPTYFLFLNVPVGKMCFLLQVINFLLIKLTWKTYLEEKRLSKSSNIRVKRGKVRFKFVKTPYRQLKEVFRRQKLKHHLLIIKLSTSGTFENYIFMAVFGLVFGVIFTFVFLYSEIYLGDATVFWCFLVRMPLLVLMTAMIAFTERGRCYLILSPFQLFSSSGKVFLVGQVMLLVAAGPLLNLRHNLNIIQESSSCQQRGVAAAAAEIADILFGPFASFKQAAKEIVNGIKTMVEKLQNILAAFKRTVMAVADAIQDATKWINSKINGCKTTVGTTYQHCMGAFSWMYDECKVNVPSVFVKMCSVTEFASNLCSSVKPAEYLCDLVFFNIDPLVTTINQRIRRLWDRAYTLLYFKIDIHHEYSIDSNSKTIGEELRARLMSVLDNAAFISSCIMAWGSLSMLLQFYFLFAMYRYRSRYLRREDFDNFFITKRLRLIDTTEALKGNDTVFPLRRVERNKYIKTRSFFLVKKEIKNFANPANIIVKTSIVLLIIGLDRVFFYITNKCRAFMLAVMQSAGSQTEISIEGSGFIAGLSRRVVRAMNHMDYNFYYTHFMPCMPNPKPPSSWTNRKIIFYLVLIWVSWAARPYALRFRHNVMDYYHPDIADRRVKWLYKSIILKRMTFMSLIQVKMRARYAGSGKEVSVADILRVRFPWITMIIGKGMLTEECIICNHVRPPLYRCPTQKCKGVYCDDCYVNVCGLCSLCQEEMMLKDFAGIQFQPVVKEVNQEDDVEIQDVTEKLDFTYQGDIPQIHRSSFRAKHFIASGSSKGNVETVQYSLLNYNYMVAMYQRDFHYSRL